MAPFGGLQDSPKGACYSSRILRGAFWILGMEDRIMKSKSKIQLKRGVGKGVRTRKDSTPTPVTLHLIVTRASGDREQYLLGEVPNLLMAIECRRRLARVPIPKKLVKVSGGVKGDLLPSTVRRKRSA